MRLLLALASVAAMIGLVGLAGPANADSDDNDAVFLAALKQAGISYQSSESVIAAGNEVCELVGAGVPDLDVVKNVKSLNPGFTLDGSARFAEIAVGVYCPQYLPPAGGGASGGGAGK